MARTMVDRIDSFLTIHACFADLDCRADTLRVAGMPGMVIGDCGAQPTIASHIQMTPTIAPSDHDRLRLVSLQQMQVP